MKTASLIGHGEIDRRLDPAAEDPDRFPALAEALLEELDEGGVDVEIVDPASWRRSGCAGSGRASFLNQFRSDVDSILTLSRQDEGRLARRIELLRMRYERWRERAGLGTEDPGRELDLDPGELARRLTLGELEIETDGLERRWFELHALRSEMVERNLYLVLINVERYSHTGVGRLDLIQEGCVSLFRAVDGFDWRRGLLFRTYAVHWLNQAFRNHLYNFGSTVRVPVYLQKALKHINQARTKLGDHNASVEEIARVTDLPEGIVATAVSAARSSRSLDAAFSEEGEGTRLRDLLVLEEDDGPYSTRLESTTLEQGLDSALAHLSARESLVVQMRFGIGLEREHTLAEVAERLGVSVERVRQIQVRALAKMNTPSLRRELDPWLN
jgi:RNA polymerase sigma factor (sigma-70 family)